MNKLELSICRATENAHRTYERITGYWLWHSPEHFLQNFILLDLGKEHTVYAEATRKKIERESGRRQRGRKPRVPGQRHDLVVWQRSDASRLRAVVEIKRNYTTKSMPLAKDARRIKQALTGSNGANSCYLLVYSEIQARHGCERLKEIFSEWAEELGLTLLNPHILDEEEFDEDRKGNICGYCLLRA
jgi:hypothetical protein